MEETAIVGLTLVLLLPGITEPMLVYATETLYRANDNRQRRAIIGGILS